MITGLRCSLCGRPAVAAWSLMARWYSISLPSQRVSRHCKLHVIPHKVMVDLGWARDH